MLRVIGCVVQKHDLGLVATALLVCILAALTSVRLLARGASSQTGLPTAWVAAAAVTFSCGVWTTHFLGMLAFVPGLPFTFSLSLCALSLAFIALPSRIAFGLWIDRPRSWSMAIIAGLSINAGIVMTHFAGMRSLRLPAVIHYDLVPIVVSLILGALLCIAAIRMLDRTHTVPAALLLTLAVSSVHFIAMGAVKLEPVAGTDVIPMSIAKSTLAILTVGGCLLILAVALAGFRLDRLMSTRLAAEARRFRALADATVEGLIVERAGLIIDINRAMCRLMGVEADKLVGKAVATVISGGVSLHPSSFDRAMEHELMLPDGGSRSVEVLWRNGPDPHGHVLAVRDISREKAAQLQIQRMAHFDQLTGVANRQLLEKTLQKALALSDRATVGIALLCIDLDRFKAINDALGPSVGDQVLVLTARRLSGVVRDTDTVARIGSDEFAVVQPLAGQPANAAALAERIVAELGLPYEIDGQTIMIGGSVGVALYPADGTTTLDLMTKAMLALNRAKREGRNTWRYCEPGMDSRLRDRRALERDLRVAVAKRQLYLAYQPFYDALTLRVAGYEALLRWNHPLRGNVSPAEFIPIAEESGLIVPIGQFVLETACAEAASWSRPLVIAVNLSPAQLAQGRIVATVDAVLHDSGLDPSLLELEITEGVLMDDTEQALTTLMALKERGVTLAMDDFGTGYSSLSYLKKFPFDKLKIDRSFVRDLDDNANGEPIVAAIIALSRSLRLEVTAEGVETPRQLALLRAERCAFIQGFLLGRPMLANQIDRHGIEAPMAVAELVETAGLETALTPLGR
ncbi:bifunctional diguanylate cyclase/phosphodiesterase [Rhodopila sp.]|uniref:bifunctional diguanylate cyclase/phosphodiesterase n=1 Tax=Rhodopila sp. TaxID=2480087 RepID=UPI003D0CD23F